MFWKVKDLICSCSPKYTGLYIILSFLTALSFVSTSCAKTLRIGIEHFPPYQTIAADGSFGGSELLKLKQALDSLHLDYIFEAYPPARQFEYIASGGIDLLLTIKSNKYAKTALFSQKPVLKIVLRMYALPGTVLSDSPDSWFGKHIIIIRGYTYGGYIKKINDLEQEGKIVVDTIDTHKNAFRMLQAQRGQYVIDYMSPSSVAIKELNMKDVQHITLFAVDVHLVMNPKFPDAKKTLAAIEKAYGQNE